MNGKGSDPREMQITLQEYYDRHERTFGKTKRTKNRGKDAKRDPRSTDPKPAPDGN